MMRPASEGNPKEESVVDFEPQSRSEEHDGMAIDREEINAVDIEIVPTSIEEISVHEAIGLP